MCVHVGVSVSVSASVCEQRCRCVFAEDIEKEDKVKPKRNRG